MDADCRGYAQVRQPTKATTHDTTSLASVGLVLLALAAGAAWLAASSLTRWRLAERLREARGETHALAQLLDVWQWQTDRDHHLVRLQPPQGAPSSAWVGRGASQHLWERFDAGDPDSLRERMAAHAMLIDVSAAQAGGHAGCCAACLASTPTACSLVTSEPHASSKRRRPPSCTQDNVAGDAEAFSYTVTHDLRAPVRVVEGFTTHPEGRLRRTLLDRIGNDHLDRVLGAAARMNSMIDALLALAQLSHAAAGAPAGQPVAAGDATSSTT